MLEWILLCLGIVGLFAGSEMVISGAKKIAEALGISELIVGLTIVAIGTSLPEIAVNVSAGFSMAHGIETSGIAIGNIIGSEIANIALVLGILGMLTTMSTSREELVSDGAMMFFSIFAFLAAAIDGELGFGEGILLVLIYLLYIVYLGKKRRVIQKTNEPLQKFDPLMQIALLIAGIGIVIFSSELVVSKGVEIARSFGTREIIIGLILGLGTSLPELAITIRAVQTNAKSLALGNLFGSNIINPLLALGLGIIAAGPFHPFTISPQVLIYTVPFWIFASVLAIGFFWFKNRLSRTESMLLIATYLVFLAAQVVLLA